MNAARTPYKLGIDVLTPYPSGKGGQLLLDNDKALADLIEGLQGQVLPIGGSDGQLLRRTGSGYQWDSSFTAFDLTVSNSVNFPDNSIPDTALSAQMRAARDAAGQHPGLGLLTE